MNIWNKIEEYQARRGNYYRCRPTRSCGKRQEWLRTRTRGHSFEDRNEEWEDVLRFAEAYNLGIVNTFFQKQEEHIITYKSGNRRTTIYYILVKRTDLKAAKDCEVISGESIAMQQNYSHGL